MFLDNNKHLSFQTALILKRLLESDRSTTFSTIFKPQLGKYEKYKYYIKLEAQKSFILSRSTDRTGETRKWTSGSPRITFGFLKCKPLTYSRLMLFAE